MAGAMMNAQGKNLHREMHQPHLRASFVLSAPNCRDLGPASGDEYALLGRSNVGKSSFINHACGDRTLARTSKTPGTTGTANLYRIAEGLYWVDLPGYGYARTGGREKERWSRLIRDYCERRHACRGIIWLVDIRHVSLAIDTEAHSWFKSLGIPVFPVLTKADKLSRGDRPKQAALFQKQCGSGLDPLCFSIKEQESRHRFWERFEVWRSVHGKRSSS